MLQVWGRTFLQKGFPQQIPVLLLYEYSTYAEAFLFYAILSSLLSRTPASTFCIISASFPVMPC